MEKTKGNFKKSRFLKILYVVGMCLLGALFVLEMQGITFAKNYSDGAERAGDYKALKSFDLKYTSTKFKIDNYLDEIIWQNAGNYKDEELVIPGHRELKNIDITYSYFDKGTNQAVESKKAVTGNTGNILYNKTIEETYFLEDGKVIAVVGENDSIRYYDKDNMDFYDSSDDYYDDEYEEELNKRRKAIDQGIKENKYEQVKVKLNGKVYSKMKNQDEISYDQLLFEKYVPNLSEHIIKAIMLFVGIMILFILSIVSAGHKKGEDDFVTNWFDHIPFLLIWIPLYASMFFYDSVDPFDDYNMFITPEIPLIIGIIILIMMLTCLYIHACTLSFARRIKAGKFYETSCTRFFVDGFKAIGRGLKEFGAFTEVSKYTGLISGIWLILMLIGIGTGNIGFMVLLVIALFVGMIIAGSSLKKLEKAGKELAAGNLKIEIEEPKFAPAPYKEYIKDLNSIKNGMENAVRQEMKSERMRTELITNVSHDIKTPLTNIINYVDLLKKAKTEEERQEYLEILGRQSERLKRLTLDLIEASKASTGNVKVNLQPLNLSEMLDQAVGEYKDRFIEAGVIPVTEVKNPPVTVTADGRHLFRVISNLLSNACKYSMTGTRVYIDAARINNNEAEIVIKNISETPLNITAEELMERFVRGDESRSSEGSGLGLDIAKSLTEIMGGTFKIIIDGDSFKVSIKLPLEKK